ncbi:hypothetical protein QCA50_009900 [Cerrena zonata]|uniref:Uncharacterized protein n=1 Tax=Cerrena zonata TaxID=2478898 RepID=A0AAW0G6S3_9APHY
MSAPATANSTSSATTPSVTPNSGNEAKAQSNGVTNVTVDPKDRKKKLIHSKPEPSVWGSKLPFQTLVGDFTNETGAWIHDVDFSDDGNSLAYVSHDSSIGIVYPEGEVYLNNNTIVAGGHNCNLIVFQGNENGWKEAYHVEKQKDLIKDVPIPGGEEEDEEEISSHDALNMFKQMDLKGRVNKPGKATGSVSTAGIDGKVVIFSI